MKLRVLITAIGVCCCAMGCRQIPSLAPHNPSPDFAASSRSRLTTSTEATTSAADAESESQSAQNATISRPDFVRPVRFEQEDQQGPTAAAPLPDASASQGTPQPSRGSSPRFEALPDLTDDEATGDNSPSGDSNYEELDPDALPTFPAVLASVETTFPLLLATLEQRSIADGRLLTANGEFDTKLFAESLSGPVGYYQTHRQRAGVVQPMYGGGYVLGGYRLGEGSFQPWYRERETNQGGELTAGFGVPLLQNRDIDKRRAGLWRSRLERNEVEPEIRTFLLMVLRDGAEAYWKWVAAGQVVTAQNDLLTLALKRASQIEERVRVDDLAQDQLVG